MDYEVIGHACRGLTKEEMEEELCKKKEDPNYQIRHSVCGEIIKPKNEIPNVP